MSKNNKRICKSLLNKTKACTLEDCPYFKVKTLNLIVGYDEILSFFMEVSSGCPYRKKVN